MKKIKIGICGWGTVATALHSSIIKNKNQIKRTHQVDLEIVAIGARRDNPKYNPGETKILRDIFDVLDEDIDVLVEFCLLYTSPSPRDLSTSRMPSSA